MPPVEPDLLLGLPQGGLLGRAVGVVDLAARERDLAGMVAQVRGPFGQEDRRLRIMHDDGHEDGGQTRLGKARRGAMTGIELVVALRVRAPVEKTGRIGPQPISGTIGEIPDARQRRDHVPAPSSTYPSGEGMR